MKWMVIEYTQTQGDIEWVVSISKLLFLTSLTPFFSLFDPQKWILETFIRILETLQTLSNCYAIWGTLCIVHWQ